jgi:two-component system, OmpR family, response regulator PhoP
MSHVLFLCDDASRFAHITEFIAKSGIVLDSKKSSVAIKASPAQVILFGVSNRNQLPTHTIQDLRTQGDRRLVMVLLGCEHTWIETVHLLDSGADDVLACDAHAEVIHRRILAVLRRERNHPQPLLLADLSIDRAQMKVSIDQEHVELTLYEYRLLECLAEHAGSIVASADILMRVRDDSVSVERMYSEKSNIVSVLISRLRKKGFDQHIKAHRGLGYSFRSPAHRVSPSTS